MPVYARVGTRAHRAGSTRGRGRPTNAGPAQVKSILEDIGEYRALKAGNAPQNDISTAINKTARKLIGLYGWDDPLRAQKETERTESGDLSLSEEEQKRRDNVVKKVRREISKIWRKNMLVGCPVTTVKPVAEIAELIRLFATRPRRKQAYKIWAKSHARPELEAEVDSRLASRTQDTSTGTATPPRVSMWNTVASEWFKASSIEEQTLARKEAQRIHAEAIERWDASASAVPMSPEEAIEFMEASQVFLGDLMHFFANRASGIAVLFIGGPSGSSLVSEGVCDVPGQPKLLYSEANPSACGQFKDQLDKQVRLLNETKWPQAPNVDHYSSGFAPTDEEQEVTARRDGEEMEANVDAHDEGSDEDQSDDESSITFAGRASELEFIVPQPSARVERQCAAQSTPSADLDGAASPHHPASFVTDGVDPWNDYDIGNPDMAVPEDLRRRDYDIRTTVTPFAPRITGYGTRSGVHPAGYNEAFHSAIAKILPYKAWLEESNTINFFKAVPTKLSGKVDEDVACALSLAYLKYESSKADEMALTMRKIQTTTEAVAVEQPRYMFDLHLRDFTSRWNGRATYGENRTTAKMDADVNVTLPRQWALLQPQERLDRQGQVCVTADSSMNWRNALSPGLEGIRILVVTLLVWAWNIRGDEERSEWSRLASDVSQVLHVLTEKVGILETDSPIRHNGDHGVNGRQRSGRQGKKSAKLRAMEGDE
ncbi:unnamed protein product [Peniophora sp. CBMAI 1063]|nr:unnamed protein product [Peniophora sp. CBMAI 1063]